MRGTNEILFAGQYLHDWIAVSVPLVQAGFQMVQVQDGLQAQEIFARREFDLAILDNRLSGKNAFDVCRFIHDNLQIPVLLITYSNDEQEILDGLEAGAADFVMRPIRPYELVARVRTILKRTSSPLALPGWIIQSGELMLDLRSRCLICSGKTILLTRMEIRLLSYFMRHAGQTISKTELIKNVWDHQPIPDDFNMVDSAIKRLRQTMAEDPKRPKYIQTVWGEGYRFDP